MSRCGDLKTCRVDDAVHLVLNALGNNAFFCDSLNAFCVADINELASRIRAGSDDLPLDLNQDGIVDLKDHSHWVTDIKQTWIGDANLDGEFNSGDFVEVFQAGTYETGEAASWGQGDWNANGLFDSSDFVIAFQGGGYEMGARTVVAAVPEPSTAILLMLSLVGVAHIRKRH